MPTDKKKAIAPREINSARGSRRFFRSADRRAASRIEDTVSSGLVLATIWQRPANAHRPLTTMVPLMVPLVSPVSRFEHWSVVKLPLAPAYRPVPPIMVQGSTWRRSPLSHKPEFLPKKHAKMLSPLAASPTIKRLPPGFPGGVNAKAKSTGSE